MDAEQNGEAELKCSVNVQLQRMQTESRLLAGVCHVAHSNMVLPAYLMVWPSLRLRSCFLYSVAASDWARAGAIEVPDAAELAAEVTSFALCECFSWSDCIQHDR